MHDAVPKHHAGQACVELGSLCKHTVIPAFDRARSHIGHSPRDASSSLCLDAAGQKLSARVLSVLLGQPTY